MEYFFMFLVVFAVFFQTIYAVYHEHLCPENEVYNPCDHMEELPCWTGPNRKERIYKNPKKLRKCRPKCNCRDTWVREWTGGECIKGSLCRADPPANWFSQDDNDKSTSTSETYEDKQ